MMLILASLRPWLVHIVSGVAIVAILSVGYFGLTTYHYNKGWNAAIAAIAEKDQQAINAAVEARTRRLACTDNDGIWNVETGQCDRR